MNQNFVFDTRISAQEKNQKSLDPDFFVANMLVPCSGMLSGQSNVEADYDRGNLESPRANEAELCLG
jgi:hypothetical protein